MVCTGNGADHCCWWEGKVCVFLEENTMADRRWVCGLRRELGSWDKVHVDARYLKSVRPFWGKHNPTLNCGTWGPGTGQCCFKEG